jgi:hypothetical protein
MEIGRGKYSRKRELPNPFSIREPAGWAGKELQIFKT